MDGRGALAWIGNNHGVGTGRWAANQWFSKYLFPIWKHFALAGRAGQMAKSPQFDCFAIKNRSFQTKSNRLIRRGFLSWIGVFSRAGHQTGRAVY
jgi:hypothetical protein